MLKQIKLNVKNLLRGAREMDPLDALVYTSFACAGVIMVSVAASFASGAYWLWMLALS
jgi:hypothetical protein